MKKENEIKNFRSKIDRIHRHIFDLLLERVQASEKIWQIKKTQQLNRIDPKREDKIIHMFDNHKKIKKNKDLKKMIHSIQKNILKENKKYLTQICRKNENN
jgi:chorismate mutase